MAPKKVEKKVEEVERSDVEIPSLDAKTKKATLRFIKTYGATVVTIDGFDFTAEILGAKKEKKDKKKKDPNAPKGAGSAYFCYLASFSESEKKKISEAAKTDGSTYQNEMSERWAAMDDKKRKPYVEQYEAKKLVYMEEKKKYDEAKKKAEEAAKKGEEAEGEKEVEVEEEEVAEEEEVEEEKPKKKGKIQAATPQMKEFVEEKKEKKEKKKDKKKK